MSGLMMKRLSIRNLNKVCSYENLRHISRVPNHHDEAKENAIDAKRKEIMARGLPKQKAIPGVGQIMIVASGKGGVGKTTTAVNLATALKIVNPQKSVGLLDADVFGPSVPLMMNLHQSPMLNKEDLMEPLINYGVKCMSMGFLVDEKSPVIWRGLMVMGALEKLIRQVAWGPLDYLVIDTPPGTGDTHLSLIQTVPLAGALLVTTPQNAALQVARRGAVMFQKLQIPLIGIVENMSSVTCPQCSHKVKLFGEGTKNLAQELALDILQSIPLDTLITETCDKGQPVVVSKPESSSATAYRKLAQNVTEFLKKEPMNST